MDLCEFEFWYEYFTGQDTWGTRNFFESGEDKWASKSTFEGWRIPGYTTLIYDNLVDLSINSIVSVAEAGFNAMKRVGAFDFSLQSAIRTVSSVGNI